VSEREKPVELVPLAARMAVAEAALQEHIRKRMVKYDRIGEPAKRGPVVLVPPFGSGDAPSEETKP